MTRHVLDTAMEKGRKAIQQAIEALDTKDFYGEYRYEMNALKEAYKAFSPYPAENQYMKAEVLAIFDAMQNKIESGEYHYCNDKTSNSMTSARSKIVKLFKIDQKGLPQ